MEVNESRCICIKQGVRLYKSYTIQINEDGKFEAILRKDFTHSGFEKFIDAMRFVDKKVEEEKYFLRADLERLFAKINDKEKTFIHNLINYSSDAIISPIVGFEDGMKVDFDKLKSFFE